ncbi:CatB-related O-acetyltransferase [Paracoccus sanguinis]|uniref:CatB-related O-acetyltransferase n=1 Tax=Paracoccus sanguinis TaxID=1545044 RepID=UPI00051FE7A8|nr:CatB-related O-acetyltransferase [Paracoccus sanguinis]KGJ17195.1 acetyltransferase [Paracoccus sanguinis]
MRFADGRENRGLVQLARAIDHPNIEVGDFTYASSFDPPADWAARLAPYIYPGAPERLRIGRFCQIADRVRIITASANHPMAGISTYPFSIFDPARVGAYIEQITGLPDTEIGNDVWLGDGALILPGARIGSGVIVGAGAVVGGTVPDYAVVVGNPARVLRMRFAPGEVARLLALRWWDWPVELIAAATDVLAQGDVDALARIGAGAA